MITPHLKKLRQIVTISAEEERAIRGLVSSTRRIEADELLVTAGEDLNASHLLLHGWLARSKDLSEGECQVTQLHVPGDFADLHGFTLKRVDHDVKAMTESTVAIVPHDRIRSMAETFPRLGRVYWFLTNVDGSMHREWALSLGQRSAISRMAHLFCELFFRLKAVGKASEDGYDMPLTQRELSECLGLTVVHANRTIQELRRRGLIELEKGRLTILDRRGLHGVADFDAAYLYLERQDL